jgi:hypothetical protein
MARARWKASRASPWPWGRRPRPAATCPTAGPSEVITRRTWSSPYLAAMANAAASHVAEQDDVHNGSVFHPATVVFPAAVAVAQAIGASGRQLLTASVAGYEVGIRVGEFPGPLALQGVPHHRHGRHAGLRRGRRQPARSGRRADAARLRLGRHAVGGTVGIPAHGRRQQAAAHRARRRRRPDVGVSGQGRLHGGGGDL